MYKITIQHTWEDETVVYVGTDNLDDALSIAEDEEVQDDLITEVEQVEPERPWWKLW